MFSWQVLVFPEIHSMSLLKSIQRIIISGNFIYIQSILNQLGWIFFFEISWSDNSLIRKELVWIPAFVICSNFFLKQRKELIQLELFVYND